MVYEREHSKERVNVTVTIRQIAGKALAYSKKQVLFGIIIPPKDITFFDEIRIGIEKAADELQNFGSLLNTGMWITKRRKKAQRLSGN